MADEVGYDALRRSERDRLELFAAAFEEIDPLDYEIFAGATASDDEIEAARAAALRAIGSGSARTAAVKRAIASFVESADRRLARRIDYPGLILGTTTVSARTEDRVNALRSLERAVVAVILWDELVEAERYVLLGPWGRVADRAFARRT